MDLTEEERERRKTEKRRNKKKRRKEKKKLEKQETRILSQNSVNCNNRRDDDSTSEDEEREGLDLNSAFVANAAAKRGVLGGGPAKERPPCPASQLHHPPPTTAREKRRGHEDIPGASLVQACQLAKRGNEAANVGQYMAAVQLFTDAICLDPSDYRFLGDRSYCFNQLKHQAKALEDAERAIEMAPEWAKGHYRRGTSLRDLGRSVDAEAAFEEVLRLDNTCREAHDEIHRIRATRIVKMGFTERQAANAIAKYINVQPALAALLAETMEDVFYSDDDEEKIMKQAKMSQRLRDVKMNPQNPEGHSSLWVGNVVPEVTEKALTQLFSKQGQVMNVRLLQQKHCAFVNFADKAAAGRAMELLQGHEFYGQKLLIKFPDNPINPGIHNHVLSKGKAAVHKKWV